VARGLAATGRDDEAKAAYVALLRTEPRHLSALHLSALVELAALAAAGGHMSAARTAYTEALRGCPQDATAHVGLANLLRNEGAFEAAAEHYQAARTGAPVQAHQGLAWVYEALGNAALAHSHRQLGFTGHAVVTRRYRGPGTATPVLLLVSARNGNIPVQGWIDEQHFAVTAIYTEFHDPAATLPPHALIVNAIGDAEACADALTAAAAIAARSRAPILNPPARVEATSRINNAIRLACLPGVVTPKMQLLPRTSVLQAGLLQAANLEFPLLLRSLGFHTGQHFTHIANSNAVAAAITSMPGDTLLAIQYLDARGPDGMARKYRVMFIDGRAYPLHLAISSDWKVHYFSAAMALNAAHRQEEQRFLTDMPAAIGATAMAALDAINQTLGLDYAGIDFALDSAGRLLVFEANATMAIVAPNDDPIWDYRRPAIAAVLHARAEMLRRRMKA
jgi:glutathione synthase/RimK-type ligase-like ATP-grasp enzyme